MSKQYAVRDADQSILCSTDQFDPALVTETISLSGGAELLICGDTDDDEIRSLKAQLHEANAANVAKETFLSNMSHDIRTPMNAIMGMTALAKRHIDEKSRVIDALDKIETASAHLLSLINDVLDMSRINSGKMTISADLFSLSDLLHEILVIVRPQMEEKKHTFRFTAGNVEKEYLYGDPLRLRQVLVNILNNSVKYTEEGGLISLNVYEEKNEDQIDLIFECEDNGIGMTEEFLQRIFEPFERVNSSTISRIEGTGLGMSIVKKTVEAMNGSIDIRSKPGEGTLITLRIPFNYEDRRIEADELAGKQVLFIEGDEETVKLVVRYLSEVGVSCESAATASEAMSFITDAEFRSKKIDVVIIGQRLGKDDSAFGIASYLHRSYPNLILILCSDANWDEIEYQASRNGIHYFIPRPFFRKSLIEGLSAAVRGNLASDGDSSLYPDLTGKKLLLVEDNLINREIAKELLSVTNAEVDTAENGKEAVDTYLSSAPGEYSLILMDIQMPIMDGYQAADAIRSSGRKDAASVPIFAMTANTFAEDIARAHDHGMNGHLAKPIDINALMQTLRQIRR